MVEKQYFNNSFLTLLNTIVDQIREGVVLCDKNGIVKTWNAECEHIYDIKKEEIIGHKLEEFFPDAIDVKVLQTGKFYKDIIHTTRGKKIMISASPIYQDNLLIGCVSTDRSLQEVVDLSEKLQDALKTIEYLKGRIDRTVNTDDFFIGTNKIMKEQLHKALMTADTDVPILITGETGTGKEVFSRIIHNESKFTGNFVAVNCSAIPDSLFESEFFGYVKGAFTGADNKGRAGYFEQADSGTLFLDEISELPLSQQTKLLRVLQEGKVRRLGSEKDIPVRVRIISACNADLQKLVDNKEFRIDLYYRIKGIDIRIPPLRERKEDLENIIQYFFEKTKKHYKRDISAISKEAIAELKKYYWAGNMRELENVMRQIVVMTRSNIIEVDNIPKEIRYTRTVPDQIYDLDSGLNEQMKQMEEQLIRSALQRSGENIAKAAKLLKIPRTTLQSKLNQINHK